MDITAARRIDELERMVKERDEIIAAFTMSLGDQDAWKRADFDWRQRTRDFAMDSENHQITRKQWKQFRANGVTLFLQANFATAYFDDAGVLWDQADDDHPMFHVMAEGDPPHRLCIHVVHLVNWIQHLAENCIPVQIVDMQFVEPDGE